MNQPCASVTVAGLGGDSGKTLVALGLAADWTEKGLRVAPFKKGPDYIDAAWLSLAANVPCRNLDTFLMPDETIRRTWDRCCREADISLIEGNRGLFDGLDARGSHSTAELAKQLNSPVLLVVDATKATASLAALVLGVRTFDPSLQLAGVVLNKTGSARHEKIAREAIETHTDVKVLGAIPRMKDAGDILPGRHLGLVTVDEHPAALVAIEQARSLVIKHVDVQALMAGSQPSDEPSESHTSPSTHIDQPQDMNAPAESVRVGVLRDSAFSFYYPENLESMEKAGAKLVYLDSMNDSAIPESIHALYIGGGFPETHAKRIAGNLPFLDAVKQATENGLPVYAECGGLMLLCRSMEFDGNNYPMAGVFPYDLKWSKKPAGHGYTIGKITGQNPFYPVGTEIRGHEFHHSLLRDQGGDEVTAVMRLTKGYGITGGQDGLCYNNVLALYTHIHASGTPEWAEGVLAAARRFKNSALIT